MHQTQASVTLGHDCCTGDLSCCPASSELLAKNIFFPKEESGGKTEEEEQLRKGIPISATKKAEWETKTSVLKHIKLGPECRKKGAGGRLAALLLQHWEEKVSIFRMEEVFQSYNIEEKPKLVQLEREGTEESRKQM